MAQSVRTDPMAPQRMLEGTNERAFQQREEGGQVSPPALSTPTALALPARDGAKKVRRWSMRTRLYTRFVRKIA